MFAQIPERLMHRVRWAIVLGWLLLITSLFWDPISSWLTLEQNTWSPFNVKYVTALECVKVQGNCLEQHPFALGAPLFWGLIVPLGVFILMVFGHELWRRICPLSFLSQIPRALGKHRHHKKVDAKTGKTRLELAKVPKDSWLGRNYPYLQLGLFYIGISSRILFVNSDRLALGSFLVGTILSAIFVGYYYGGKSWCHYFCPMAPVQKIYGEPRALLNSTAHIGERQPITQSMCRTVNAEGKENSACIACNTPCIDIDAERSYWEDITKPEQQLLYYAYVGLTVGYFVYYYLYAGNWEYYMSGSWAHETNQLGNLFKPGFYFFGQSIAIPKLIAAPLTIAGFGAISYWVGRKVENRYKGYLFRNHKLVSTEVVRHRMFTVCTFFIFNFFFIFGGRAYVRMLPIQLQYVFPVVMAVVSSLWLYRTWPRNPHVYQRESLASRLRKQLSKLNLNLAQFLEGRSLDDLETDEVYVLAKILPGFDKEKRIKAYKGVLKESITERYVDSETSLDMLLQMRLELNITEEEHKLVLTELEIEDPILVNPSKKTNHENWLRQESYREALLNTIMESSKDHPSQGIIIDLFDVMTGKKPFESFNELLNSLSTQELQAVNAIREEYSITPQEEKEIITHTDPRQLWHSMAYTFSVIEHIDAIAEGRTPISCKIEEMNEEQRAFCRVIFNKFDKDGNDCLSAAELRSLLRAVGRPYSSQRVQELMDMITGSTNSNRITFSEFATLLHRDLAEGEEPEMLKRFHLFDADGSGYITLEELRVCLKDIDENISDANIEAMLKHADTSGDEQISYEEFCQLFGQLQTN